MEMSDRIPVFKPSFADAEFAAVQDVLSSGWIGRGPRTIEFEQAFADYVGVEHAVSVNSATAALHIAMLLAQVDGQEVLTCSLTFVSSNQAIVLGGGRPVFCDIDPETLTIDPEEVARKVTPTTRAILVVHYAGHPCDMDPIMEVAQAHGLTVVEDAAHGCGGSYKGRMMGSLGDLGCFSFQATKNMTTGDGGMLVTNDGPLAERARKLRWVGISRPTWERFRSGEPRRSWMYEVEEVGYKYEMNDLAAAIGLAQLSRLEQLNGERRRLLKRYREAFADLDDLAVLPQRSHAESACYSAVIRCSNRDALYAHLDAEGIDSNVHYYPNHMLPIFRSYTTRLPETEAQWQKILTIPLHPELSTQDQDRVIDSIRRFALGETAGEASKIDEPTPLEPTPVEPTPVANA